MVQRKGRAGGCVARVTDVGLDLGRQANTVSGWLIQSTQKRITEEAFGQPIDPLEEDLRQR